MLWVRVELNFPSRKFLIDIELSCPSKFIVFYFISVCMLSFDFNPGYGFGNSEAYYGPQELYTNPGPSASLACGIGS